MPSEFNCYVTLAWDLPSENVKELVLIKNEDEQVRKDKLKLRSWLSSTRLGFYHEMKLLGRHVNRSVFIIPPASVAKVKKLIRDYDGRYRHKEEDLKREGNPYVQDFAMDANSFALIKFAEGETGRLRRMAQEKLKRDLSNFVNDLGRFYASSTTVRSTTKRRLKREAQALQDIIQSFGLSEQFERTIELCFKKLDELVERDGE